MQRIANWPAETFGTALENSSAVSGRLRRHRSARYFIEVACAVMLFAAASPVLAQSQTYITIDASHLEGFKHWHAARTRQRDQAASALSAFQTPALAVRGGVVATRVPTELLPSLGEFMHERRNVCGGYFAFQRAEEATQFVDDGAAAALDAAGFAVNHTVDNQAFVQPLLSQVQESRIRSTITSLQGFTNRWYNGAPGRQSSEWIRDQWRALIPASRPEITVSLVSCASCGQQQNVVLTIPGSDLASEIVVLGAHADSIVTGQSSPSTRAPGADDDGSGIAVLTEVIQLAMQSNYRPRRSVHIVGYAAEEVGLRGSKALAQSYRGSSKNVVGVLQFDMTNYRNPATTRDLWVMTDNSNASLVAFLRELFNTYLAGSGLTLGDTSCGYACSDHASWTQSGFPAAMYSESRFGQHNQNIHTARDTLANSGGTANHSVHFAKLGVAFMAEAAKGNGNGGGGDPDPLLQNGVPVNDISLATGEQRFYRFEVPAGQASARFITNGGSGDIDIYIGVGGRPTTTSNVCKSEGPTTAETCTISNPAAGTYYVLLNGYSAAVGASLTATYNP